MFTFLVASGNAIQVNTIENTLTSSFPGSSIMLKATSHQKLMNYIYNVRIDIALLDLDLEGANFQELSDQLHQSNPNCIIIILANHFTLDSIQLSQDLSVMDYLITPYTDHELILTFEEAFELCRRIRTEAASSSNSRLSLIKDQIEGFIQGNYAQINSMQDVAKVMNYSDTHFCRLFKQCFHINFSVYLNEFRVEQAKIMLANSNLTVKEVSLSCGYRDTSYFIRVFKRITGTTPSDYRISKLTMTAKKSNES